MSLKTENESGFHCPAPPAVDHPTLQQARGEAKGPANTEGSVLGHSSLKPISAAFCGMAGPRVTPDLIEAQAFKPPC